MENEIIGSALTLAGGLIIFAVGQVISKLLDPMYHV